MKPTEMVLRPALKLAYLLAVATFAACVTLLLLPLPMPLRLGLVLLVSWLAVYLMRRDVLLALPHSWQSVTLNSKDEIVMTQKNGQHFVCQVLPDSVVFRHLTVLRLKLNDRFWPRSLILLAGSADADELRRWRIWLRWGIKWASRSRQH